VTDDKNPEILNFVWTQKKHLNYFALLRDKKLG
jgi:hypothetical protein